MNYRSRLASGATWQGAGRVTHLQNTLIETHFAKYSRQLYERLQKEGHDVGKSSEDDACHCLCT
jgi:hypothetical protein